MSQTGLRVPFTASPRLAWNKEIKKNPLLLHVAWQHRHSCIPVHFFIPQPLPKKNSSIRNFGRKQNLRVPQLQVLGFVRYEKVLRSKHSSRDLEGTFLRNNKFDFIIVQLLWGQGIEEKIYWCLGALPVFRFHKLHNTDHCVHVCPWEPGLDRCEHRRVELLKLKWTETD